ncbi:membrane-associated protein [Kineococcus xinjiangensis]|uniref:Membrane-associated protein n=1 Tax=Kineococcus xinjiangensis TaxID=512762 RepID=A0A2S6IF87_9ACTN|nr:VTT domain-containing protein [Kineococcus xinjiangensis]PPK92863.1 membrane-associated protein [Kineococcus xinjiangensis]
MDITGWVADLLTSAWAYVAVVGVIAAAGVVAPLPSEATMATAIALGVAGDLELGWVCLATTAGSLTGDVAAYALGRWIGHRAGHRVAASDRAGAALRWLARHERSWGPGLIVGARFVPGGTTSVGVAAGLLLHPLRSFALWALVGSLVWTGYGVALALLARAAFPGGTWPALVLPVVVAVSAGGLLCAAALRWRRRGRRTGEAEVRVQQS